VALTTHPHPVPRLKKDHSYTSTPLLGFCGLFQGELYVYLPLYFQYLEYKFVTTKGKAEGSRKLRFPDFMTTAQDGGKVVSLKHRPPLPPGNAPGTHFC